MLRVLRRQPRGAPHPHAPPQNAYFPLFITEDVLMTEKEHVAGFAPEVGRAAAVASQLDCSWRQPRHADGAGQLGAGGSVLGRQRGSTWRASPPSWAAVRLLRDVGQRCSEEHLRPCSHVDGRACGPWCGGTGCWNEVSVLLMD